MLFFFLFFDSAHGKIDDDIYLKVFGCSLVLYTHQIQSNYYKCFMFIPLVYQIWKHWRQYLTKESVSSEYRKYNKVVKVVNTAWK